MLKGSNISFCDKQAFNIIDDDLKKHILDILKKDYFITIKDRNFYIINKRNINYIEKQPFIVSIKSIGSLYYLFLTKIDNKNYCFYIDKKVKEGHSYPRILSVLYRFDDSIFNNTLFDGELLRNNNNNWMFIINNLILYKGEILKNKNIIYKLNKVYEILNENYIKDDHLEICPLYVKRLFSYHEWTYIMNEYIPNLNYKYKGLYFENTKINKNYLFITPRNNIYNKQNNNNNSKNNKQSNNSQTKQIIENKYLDKKYMNFLIRKTEIADIYDLYCLDNNELCKYDVALINSLKTSKKLNKLFTNNDKLVFECEYNNINKKWIPINSNTNDINTKNEIINFIKS